jgi:hypothetical protein
LTSDISALEVIDDKPKQLPPANTIGVTQLAAILKHKKEIVKWLDDAEDYALERMKAGHKVPGYKLVKSRGGHRYWLSPMQAAKLLVETTVLRRDEVIEEKVISPSAVESLIGKKKFTVELMNLIGKPPGSPTIAPEDDPRDDLLADAASDFDALP